MREKNTTRSSRDKESASVGCLPRTNDRENALKSMDVKERRFTAGTVSNMRGSVRASRVCWSIEDVSWTLSLAKSSESVSLISGSGLSVDEATGVSMSSVGLSNQSI